MGIKNLILHCHTDMSVKDGAMTPTELVKRAKELGAPAVTLTDHGNLVGVYEFLDAAKKEGIKGIPGVEAYVVKDNNDEVRKHLILLAKDEIGYRAISKAVTESNHHLEVLKTKSIPLMNKELLTKWFGQGTKGHGHVFATSACAGGVIAAIINHNDRYNAMIEKAKTVQQKYHSPNEPAYKNMVAERESLKEKVSELKKELTELKKAVNKSVSKAESYMHKRVGTAEYASAKEAYEKLLASKEKAAVDLDRVTAEVNSLNNKLRGICKSIKNIEKDFPMFEKYEQKGKECTAKIISEEKLREMAVEETQWYVNTFGEGNFFVEIQYHGLDNEFRAMPALIGIAKELNVPMVPANDAHYARKSDYRKREILVADSFKRELEKPAPPDMELYIKTDEELANMLSLIAPPSEVEKMFQNLAIIADNCNVDLKFEAHYPKFWGLPEGMTEGEYIRKLCIEGIAKRYPDNKEWDKEHSERLEYELKIIDQMGYNDYHLVVQDYLNYGRSLAVQNPEKVGYTIGPGRGSAVGSLVCYLLGITDLDPIKYGLYFERYLNPERVSMPDIDADFANYVRGSCIDYMKKRYGQEGVCGITTQTTIAAKGAIDLVCRVTPNANIALAKAIKKQIPRGTQVTLHSPFSEKGGKTVEEHLLSVFTDPLSQQVIKDAAAVEGLTTAFGRHAAAVVISDTNDVSEQVPLIKNDKDQWAIQCFKEQAESNAGLLKFDFLGLKTLDIITSALRKIARNYGIRIDISNIPFEEEVFSEIYASGNTQGVFQFASPGMVDMVKRFKPSSIEDIILLNAAYRPGPMQYLDDIVEIKHGRKAKRYEIKELAPILDDTYGKPIYQEQVQSIFKELAGYSLGQADLVRRAMSKKKLSVLEKERKAFIYGDAERKIKGCKANGISEDAANKLFDELTAFAEYAFNKSHAAAYSVLSYQTAWLKYHYTEEFMAAVIEYAAYDERQKYYANCSEMGIKLELPDINESLQGFKAGKKSLRIGFNAMKGVGDIDAENILAERKKGAFSSIKGFVMRTDVSVTTAEALINGGALDCFCGGNRKALLKAYNDLTEIKKEIKKCEQKIEKNKIAAENAAAIEDAKALKRCERNCKNYNSQLELLKQKLAEYPIADNIFEGMLIKLIREKDVLGTFVSGNPLSSYEVKSKVTRIKDINCGEHIICGVISDRQILHVKKTGAEFAGFTVDDGTGSIRVTVFPKYYGFIREKISDDAVICLKGIVKEDDYSDNEEGNVIYQFTATGLAEELKKKVNSAVLRVPNCVRWFEMAQELSEHYAVNSDAGLNLLVYDESMCELRETGLRVSESILYAGYDITKSDIVA